jgi:ArsR family transcriptional regulator
MEKNNKAGEYKKMIKKLAEKIDNKAHISYVSSDPTRLKILMILSKNRKMCTSDLANILGVSVSAVSHQKTILESYGLIASQREGKKICCHLSDKELSREILKGIK